MHGIALVNKGTAVPYNIFIRGESMKKIIKNIFIYLVAIMNPKSVIFLVNRRSEIEEMINHSQKTIAKSLELSNNFKARLRLLEEKV